MISPAKYYPEFDSAEVEETIVPLSQFDDQFTGVLRAGGESADEPPSPGEKTRATVREWLGRPEQYPFQSVIRGIAAGVAGTDPVAPFGKLFSDPDAMLVQLLERTESRVREVYSRPLVAAINHAREEGRLVGETPEERYRYFVDQARLTSFEEVSGLSFPVLRDITRILLANGAESVTELCRRLVADREAIAGTFGIEVTDRIVSCGFSEGDAHNHGRSVSVLEFESGKKLVYKPRDVSCEAAYEHIAAELNKEIGTSLAAAQVLERNHYGYVEFIETEDVSDMSGEFMRASGELAAVLYLLNARDMHFENILPTRRGPVPIDLETILHPARIHEGPTPEAVGNAYETIGQSIYGIGILPLVMVGKGEDAGHVDLGFLGDQGRGSSPFKSIFFENPYTDRISLVIRAQEAQGRRTVVNSLGEDEVRVLGDRMAEGFSRVFRTMMSSQERWAELLRKAASGMRVRYVHNPTALYAQTLRMTSSAGALDDVSPYIALLKRIAIASKTSSRQIVRSEIRQLAERDIPYFTVSATGVALEDGDGREVGAFFDETPVDRALAKTAHMTETDLREQLRLVYSAFSSRFPDNHLAASGTADGGAFHAPSDHETGGDSHGELVGLVERLAGNLVETSLPDKFAHLPRTWIGPLASAAANRPWPPGVLGYDLYTGRVGPALALAAAGRFLDRGDYRDLAGQIFSTMADILAEHRYERRSVQQAGFGGYTGMAGILFALATTGRLLENDEWVEAAQGALPLVLDQIRDIDPRVLPIDVVNGVAGVMGCVTAIGGPHADGALATLTGMLTDAVRDGGHGSVFAQSGFAHGVSGLLHALSGALPRVPSGQQDVVRDTLKDLVGRLQKFYDSEQGNWFSNVATPQSFSTGWCHGATGIALALSSYGNVAEDDVVNCMRDVAIGNLVRHGFGRNLTWCHGDLGNHDVLTGLAADDESLREEVARIEQRWLQPDVLTRKINDNQSRYAHTNSLMVGTAGIVLHLVNRLDPSVHISPVTLTFESR
ncbi:type 2 lantibiotic biosynthesis protein [Streptomyces daqingensis]|uniref:Type 2 lantibiotic biosynthesis protein n=1 Tax=Streptomyces daqingensis TaxID=1472640 RepID=A0ABQ2M4V3_9ACTN|nr:type 2 lanthipeptide synthetase LanM family protein [Streptomyces daqingensis]GGO47195.1 type 2 lantibiotic biosynthesis protein [Streptomyces daqingensis]